MLYREDMGMGSRGCTPGVGDMSVFPHMMWMSTQVVPLVVKESIVLSLYLDQHGFTFHIKTGQMKYLVQ